MTRTINNDVQCINRDHGTEADWKESTATSELVN